MRAALCVNGFSTQRRQHGVERASAGVQLGVAPESVRLWDWKGDESSVRKDGTRSAPGCRVEALSAEDEAHTGVGGGIEEVSVRGGLPTWSSSRSVPVDRMLSRIHLRGT